MLSEHFDSSVIVAAHPDDEILWFSSILDQVNQIILCFIGSKNKPTLSAERKACLGKYPLKTIMSLDFDQSDTFGGADWDSPVLTNYGMEVSNRPDSVARYLLNYHELRKRLRQELVGFTNVFTHNPWGEYGHEEHVQVYRVIKELQNELGFKLWVSNYCSNKSCTLMIKYFSNYSSDYILLKTNPELFNSIKKLYQKNNCWTWFSNWKCFENESFIDDKATALNDIGGGRLFPLNMINVPYEPQRRKIFFNRVRDKIMSVLKIETGTINEN